MRIIKTKEQREQLKQEKEQRAIERKNRKEAKKQAINAKRLNERIAKTADKYANDVLKSMNSGKPSFEIKLSKQIKGENRKLYAKAIINNIINKGKDNKENFLWIKTSNSSEVPLNDANRKLFDNYINGEAVEINKFNKQSGEQIETIVKQLDTYAPLNIIIKPKEFKNKITKGAFFPYYNRTSLNLVRYQIVDGLTKQITEEDVDLYNLKLNKIPNFKPVKNIETLERITMSNNILKENCLIYAFRLLGMSDDELYRCSDYVKNRHIAQDELRKLANELKINIILRSLRKDDSRIHKIQYGDPEGKTYNIALHSNHYFIYDEHTEYTSFYVKNYNLLKNERDAQNIVGYRTGTTKYIKDKRPSYYISSLHLVDELTKSKDNLLLPITNQNINLYDEIFVDHKLKDDFLNINLNYDFEGTTTNEIQYEEHSAVRKRKKYDNYDFIVADFETYDNNYIHEAYLINGATLDFDNKTLINQFSYRYNKDSDLIETFLRSLKRDTVLIYHNAKFDYNFLVPYLSKCSETINDGNFISFKGMFGKYKIVIKCSYKLITEPLRKFPSMFNLPKTQKEVIKHSFYNKENVVKQYHSLEDFIKPFNKTNQEIVIKNINKWNCLTPNNEVDIIEYSKRYCDMDVEILGKGYLIFREWILDYFDEDINTHLTLPSVVSNIFLKRGVFDGCYELSGLPRDFIAKSMIGGRCMLARNTKHKVKARLNDLDATSLYPSGMKRMKGFMKGQPKPLIPEQINKQFLDGTDYYFVSVRINKVNKHLDFPLLRKITDEGKKTFTNEMEGEIVYLGKTALEDAIKYHNIEYEIINGYYFNEGFNTSINSIITEIFNRRATLKREDNPAQLIFKLLMNASYGKLLQKAPDTKTKIMDDKDNDIKVYLSRNHATIKSITRIDPPSNTLYNFKGKCRIDSITAQSTHYNKIHLGIVILDETKRIMSEVMTTAQDENIPIYYQDTDSMMLHDADIPKLEEVFMAKYGRKLVGKDLGQFNSDLNPEDDSEACGKKIKDIYATEGIFVGKKAYILKVECVDEEGKVYDAGYHSRCKGVNTQSIEHLLSKPEHKGRDKLDIYNDWYEGKAYDLDLTAGQTVCSMEIDLKKNTIKNRQEFIRNIKF
jgi:hypothetical protein